MTMGHRKNRRVGQVIETHQARRILWWVSMTRPTLRRSDSYSCPMDAHAVG